MVGRRNAAPPEVHPPVQPRRRDGLPGVLLQFLGTALLLQEQDLYLPATELAYCGHWITAPGRARRFDTRFFVAVAPEGQAGSHDDAEMVHHLWLTPREALERAARGEIELVHATREILNELKNFATAGEALRHVRALKEIEEPRPSEEYCQAYPSQRGWRDHAALFLYVRAEKPKSRRNV